MCLAVPGKLLDTKNDPIFGKTGRVSFGGIFKEVNLSCVPEARIGDHVLVHVGMALSVIDEEEAKKVFKHLARMDELAELEENQN